MAKKTTNEDKGGDLDENTDNRLEKSLRRFYVYIQGDPWQREASKACVRMLTSANLGKEESVFQNFYIVSHKEPASVAETNLKAYKGHRE